MSPSAVCILVIVSAVAVATAAVLGNIYCEWPHSRKAYNRNGVKRGRGAEQLS